MCRALLATCLAIAAAVHAVPAGAVVPCPASTIASGPALYLSSSAPVADAAGSAGSGRWDMPAGLVHMYSTGTLTGIAVDVVDDFDVTGVPSGTPVPLVAELTVDGAVWTDGCGGSGCGGSYSVKLYHGADSLEVLHSDHLFTGRLDHHDVIALPLTIVAGQPERLRIRAYGRRSPGGAHESEANSVLRFTGAPAGVLATSCKGYNPAATPALRRTWGAVKQIYR
jgi:hypothetical protein